MKNKIIESIYALIWKKSSLDIYNMNLIIEWAISDDKNSVRYYAEKNIYYQVLDALLVNKNLILNEGKIEIKSGEEIQISVNK